MLKLAKVKFLNINYKQSIRPYQRYDLINAIFFLFHLEIIVKTM